ncbi:MAG TPA: amidohydrolase family protein [Kofleriaceae bacterium]|nr:amidohydrolase family protein [Kofleriaceae bacterium]
MLSKTSTFLTLLLAAVAPVMAACTMDGDDEASPFDEEDNEDSLGLRGDEGGKADGEGHYRSGCPGDEIRAGRWAVRGDIVTPTSIIRKGILVINGEKIERIESATWVSPTPITIVDTGNSLVFPGLIDGHSHVEYNHIPLADLGKRYTNRDQWPNASLYKTLVKDPKNAVTAAGLKCEALRWGEARALVGGTTAIQGTPETSCIRPLVRNLEMVNFCQDKVRQNVMSAIDFDRGISGKPSFADSVKAGVKDGSLDAFVVHIGEGIDEEIRAEWGYLKDMGLDLPQAVMIHTAAFTPADYQEVGEVGAKIVWSPLSNLLLYGGTANIPAAMDAGVLVSLGADWAPSGSANLLGELKVAARVNKKLWGSRITNRQLVDMVTINPAKAYGLDEFVGSLEPGKAADLLVIRKVSGKETYKTLVEARPQDVMLVTISGDPLFGTADLMTKAGKGGDFETVDACGEPRAIDITVSSGDVSKGTETVDYTRSKLIAVNPKLTPIIDCTDDEATKAYAGTPVQ